MPNAPEQEARARIDAQLAACGWAVEQMKGRGTRVLTPTDLQAVSGAEAHAKTHFVIVDAVGVCESDKTESRPLDRKPAVPLKNLLQRVIFPGGRDEDTLTTLASRLARLDRELDDAQRKQIVQASGGATPSTLAASLLRAFDPDAVVTFASGDPKVDAAAIPRAEYETAQRQLIAEACAPFDKKPALRETLENLKRETEQAIDIFTLDEIASQGFDAAAKEKAAGLVQSFRDYLATHQAEIDALQILYSQRKAHQLFGAELPSLMDELNEELAA